MFEKVNPSHPDKIADRIAGALVDIAYRRSERPRIAVEVLLGHGVCHIIAETSVHISDRDVEETVRRIAGEATQVDYTEVPQDPHLAENQKDGPRCGDNGIFKGTPVTREQTKLVNIARAIYEGFPFDGKYILVGDALTICQSNVPKDRLASMYPDAVINPLGDWTGGPDTDSGATNRKLGSDMGDSVTGGGLHGKDCSKADVSANIYCWLLAQRVGKEISAFCSIGDDNLHIITENGIENIPYSEVVQEAKEYIDRIGGFETFAEWGLV